MGATGPISKEALGQPSHGHAKVAKAAAVVALPVNARAVPDAPAHLGDAGMTAWKRSWEAAAWLGTAADEEVVGMYCELVDERAELRNLVRDHGRTTRGSQGQMVDHPHVGQLRAVEAEIVKLWAVIGLGPVNQAKLGITIKALAKQDDDPSRFEQLRRQRGTG
jgi:P27 family predicted phage terminase small subunit